MTLFPVMKASEFVALQTMFAVGGKAQFLCSKPNNNTRTNFTSRVCTVLATRDCSRTVPETPPTSAASAQTLAGPVDTGESS